MSVPNWSWIVFAGMLFLPAGGVAQEGDSQCGRIYEDCSVSNPDGHNFVEHWSEESEPHEGEGYHGTCLICASGGEAVEPTHCHPNCVGGGFSDVRDSAYYQELLRRIENRDRWAALELAAEIPEVAYVNWNRGSLQVMGCAGEVVANLPLGDLLHATRGGTAASQ